jgi:mannose-6-phosphate isomerase-like protein (cupin superfamily)
MTISFKPHQKKVTKPWGYEVIYTPDGSAHTGKILSIQAGCRLSLQYHDQKIETLCLVAGEAFVWLESDGGEMNRIPMEKERGYHVTPGQKHRLEAVTDAVVIEVSDPEKGNTFRISDDYSRPDETEQLRAMGNRGWQPNG